MDHSKTGLGVKTWDLGVLIKIVSGFGQVKYELIGRCEPIFSGLWSAIWFVPDDVISQQPSFVL